MKPFAASGCVDAGFDDVDHDVVGNELAAVHDRLGALADLGTRRNGRPQHVARGKLDDAVPADQTLRLGTLTRARRPEQDEPHRVRPFSRVFLTRPSY